ncbi:hypothetical protein CTI12_AA452160 [Artemisia annua]|uniref:Uncharacterized protein n=1 Tax=Artemisia annua TaxID=35608 RepID=A0A2U1LUI6_ARTAN|nr:hypothetical protein CTI12_AA452160 [Artemisia annua]
MEHKSGDVKRDTVSIASGNNVTTSMGLETGLDSPTYMIDPVTQPRKVLTKMDYAIAHAKKKHKREVVQSLDKVEDAIAYEKRVNTLDIPSFSLGTTRNFQSAIGIENGHRTIIDQRKEIQPSNALTISFCPLLNQMGDGRMRYGKRVITLSERRIRVSDSPGDKNLSTMR